MLINFLNSWEERMNVAMDFTEQLPKEWDDWITTNIMRGISKEVIIQTLKDNNFSDTQIQIALKKGLNRDTNENCQTI